MRQRLSHLSRQVCARFGIHDWRELIRVAAVFTAAATAGLAITMPISYGWFTAETYQVDLMIANVPSALAAGAAVAVVSASIVVGLGSSRAGWYATTLALLGILANHAGLPWVDIDSLTTFNFIDSLWAGVILGALPVAVWTQTAQAGGYLFGCISSTLVGDLAQAPLEDIAAIRIDRLLSGAPPLWLIVSALVLIVVTLTASTTVAPVMRTGSVLPMAPIVAGMIAIAALMFVAHWLVRDGDRWPVVAAGAVMVIVTAMVCALILPARDGVMLLLLLAATSTDGALITVPRPWWTEIGAVIAVAAGMICAWRWPRPYVAVGASAMLAIGAAVIAVTETSGKAWAVGAVLAIGLIAGYSVTAAIPTRVTSAVLAIAVLYIPPASAALRGRSFGRLGYSPNWYRVPGPGYDPVPAYAAVAIGAGCALGVYLLGRHRRVPSEVLTN